MNAKRNSVTGLSISEIAAGWSALGLETYAEATGVDRSAILEHFGRLVWRRHGKALEDHLRGKDQARMERDIADRLERANDRLPAASDIPAMARAYLPQPKKPSASALKRDRLRAEALRMTAELGVDLSGAYQAAFERVARERRPMSFPTGRQFRGGG